MENTLELNNFDNQVINKVRKSFDKLIESDITFKKYFKLHTGTAEEILSEYMKITFFLMEPAIKALVDEDYILLKKIKAIIEDIEVTILTKLKGFRPDMYEELADTLLTHMPKYFEIIHNAVEKASK